MQKIICWILKKFPRAAFFYALFSTTTEQEALHYVQMFYHPNAPVDYYAPTCHITTEREINKTLEKFDKLDYPIKYWIFERFINDNLHQLDYFIALLKHKKEGTKNDDDNQ